jgi:hypothetical protein
MTKSAHIGLEDFDLLKRLQEQADKHHDGHLTIYKFTTNWRVGFETPTDREDIDDACVGKTFRDAAKAALSDTSED